MSDAESLSDFERRLAGVSSPYAPTELRADVLRDVHRELAAARWDRRLARAAAVLLAIGVGMNLAMGLQSSGSSSATRRVAGGPSRDSLVQVAVTVAEATDPETGSRYARQMAAMSGVSLSSEQSAAIDAAVKLHARPAAANGKDG
jgi:hypothetical protein